MLQQLDRWNKCVCVQMENTSKAIKFVNHGFHITKTYSHIPDNFLNAPRESKHLKSLLASTSTDG
jgi:hypothetical protein